MGSLFGKAKKEIKPDVNTTDVNTTDASIEKVELIPLIQEESDKSTIELSATKIVLMHLIKIGNPELDEKMIDNMVRAMSEEFAEGSLKMGNMSRSKLRPLSLSRNLLGLN